MRLKFCSKWMQNSFEVLTDNIFHSVELNHKLWFDISVTQSGGLISEIVCLASELYGYFTTDNSS